MNSKKHSYQAVKIIQANGSNPIILFAAPATDIREWVGIPQKKKISGGETTGFQREENKKRINQLKAFYSNSSNVIQNPLLCATRNSSAGRVKFISNNPESQNNAVTSGTLEIEYSDIENWSLLFILKAIKEDLEKRVPTLKEQVLNDTKLAQFKKRLLTEETELEEDSDNETEEPDESTTDESESEDIDSGVQDSAGQAFSDESHIIEFWEDIALRVALIEDVKGSKPDWNPEHILGYSKKAMIEFLQPVIVVDGQHRLKGALLAAEHYLTTKEGKKEAEELIINGMPAEDVNNYLTSKVVRYLPISLMIAPNPSEHVFQFVVVNQKATPIGNSLLGTIVSTSLSNEEISFISKRLEDAGIPLEDSRAITFMARAPQSPFVNLVDKGLTSNDGIASNELLQWNVMGNLIKIFRFLKGGKLFHMTPDYANIWKTSGLEKSAIVNLDPSSQFKTKYDLWSSADGPWRDVFIAFWSTVRDRLANTTDPEQHNYWGSARKSQIFNKISLTILAADFFQFLAQRKMPIDSTADIVTIVDEWLEGVDPTYFSKDWELKGVKKDSTGIKKQWAKLWNEYRQDTTNKKPYPKERFRESYKG